MCPSVRLTSLLTYSRQPLQRTSTVVVEGLRRSQSRRRRYRFKLFQETPPALGSQSPGFPIIDVPREEVQNIQKRSIVCNNDQNIFSSIKGLKPLNRLHRLLHMLLHPRRQTIEWALSRIWNKTRQLEAKATPTLWGYCSAQHTRRHTIRQRSESIWSKLRDMMASIAAQEYPGIFRRPAQSGDVGLRCDRAFPTARRSHPRRSPGPGIHRRSWYWWKNWLPGRCGLGRRCREWGNPGWWGSRACTVLSNRGQRQARC